LAAAPIVEFAMNYESGTEDPHAPEARVNDSIASAPRIGPYVLVKKLGEGGMGAVWLAEQQEPIRRKVALKFIRDGLDAGNLAARFSSERQALALMQHPAIAHVYDTGATDDGKPYFVMEYIEGVPVTEYCDAHRLTITERLGLFVDICDGMQHAHQKAILHRDLKPSNVLVTELDGKPTVRIIDFGLAKSLSSPETTMAQRTIAGEVVGTPRYMSPEQLDFSPNGIDTRTDVYSLGVVLYELLTGTTPHSNTRAFDELLTNIRHGDVSPPSGRFAKNTPESIEAAAKLAATADAVRKQLEGDLDWITLKALANDREQRYSSASEFAADIRRHLQNEPVQARRPSASYRMAKFVKRNRLAVGLAGVAAVAVVGLAVAMTVQAIRIAKERDRANHEAETARDIAQFLTRMFRVSDPSQARGKSVTAREILDNASQQIQSNLTQSPEVRGRLMSTMGETYLGLGLSQQAKPLLEQAIQVQSQALGRNNPATLRSMTYLGDAMYTLGHYQDAEKLLRSIFETQLRELGPDNQDTLLCENVLAEDLTAASKSKESEAMARDGVQRQSRLLGPEAPDTLRFRRILSRALLDQRKFPEAEKQTRETLEMHRRRLGADHPATLYEASLLAGALKNLGRLSDAEKLDRETLEIQKRVLGPEHNNTLATATDLAEVLGNQKRLPEAIQIYRETLAIRMKLDGPDHPHTTAVQNGLAIAYATEKQFGKAEPLFRAIAEVRRRTLLPGHRQIVYALCNLAITLSYMGEHVAAEQVFRDAVSEAQRGESSVPLATAYFYYGSGAALAGRHKQALEMLDRAAAVGLPATIDLATTDDLKSLRGDARFEALVAQRKASSSTTAKR
jgi:non-specific serine/threonine protein kinase/serine/threonine-protein kinase